MMQDMCIARNHTMYVAISQPVSDAGCAHVTALRFNTVLGASVERASTTITTEVDRSMVALLLRTIGELC
jgi:hypothetical protein